MRPAHLSASDVREIFRLLADNQLCHWQIAEIFGVSRETITMINQGKQWRKLTPPGWKPAPPVHARGERNGWSVLSADDVREI
jgi:hypothetical protein